MNFDTLKYIAKELERGSSAEQIAGDITSNPDNRQKVVGLIDEIVVIAGEIEDSIK